MESASLPQGVLLTPIRRHEDERGHLSEIFRASWATEMAPVQWNVVHSVPNVLRGFHIHVRHADYLVMAAGRMLLGLKDLRPDSPTHDLATRIVLDAASPVGVTIPTGVGHAFYFPVPSVLVHSVSEYWSPADELRCRWDDPELGIDWPTADPLLSPRDTAAGTFGQMRDTYLAESRLAGSLPR